MKLWSSLLMALVVAGVAVAQDSATLDADTATLTAVSVDSGVASFSEANAQINFVGEHEGPKPDPRKGGFSEFSGQIKVGGDSSIESVSFDIDTGSLFTEIDKLTGHLKSPDFFDVRQHPKASFASTAVAKGDSADELQVTGDLTLLGNTQEITIPAKASVTSDGVTLVSDFTIDRTNFGMTYGDGKVKKEVSIKVMIGAPTTGG